MRMGIDQSADGGAGAPGRLKRRAEFLRVGKGRRWHGKAMTIQAEARADVLETASPSPRFGFTLTKKVGNAVVRNRARRRLREAVRLASFDLPARAGHDYVVVGRLEALRLPFAALREELARGVAAVHSHGKEARGRTAGRRDAAARHDPPRESIAPATGGPERTRRER